MSLIKFSKNVPLVIIIVTLISSFFVKTTLGQIVVGLGSFMLIMSANLSYIKKKEGPIRLIVFVNILLVLVISCMLSDIYFKRPDIALYLAGASLLFVGSFEAIELTIRRKRKQ